MTLLDIKNLEVSFSARKGDLRILHGIDLTLQPGEILGLVGESGSGKSVLAKAILGLLPGGGSVSKGAVLFEGQDLAQADPKAMRKIRGNRIAMIFQDPMATLNPVLRIDEQMREAITAHHSLPRAEVNARCIAILNKVGIPAPEERFVSFPHQLSGGMRQRIAIAIALLNDPVLILADEATTALDVTVQAQILHEMHRLCADEGTALIWVSHDLSVVSGIADRIAVMYAGRVVECGPVEQIVLNPRHPYTLGLIRSVPAEDSTGHELHQIPGLMPSPGALPQGCVFAARCFAATAHCRDVAPEYTETNGHGFACHVPNQGGQI